MTHYMPQNMDDVHKAVGAIDDDVPVLIVPVDVIPGAPLHEVHTVRDLRALPAWPTGHRLIVELHPLIEVRVELP
jgi:hypothetical protein